MSTFCQARAVDCEAAVESVETDERFRDFGERISIVSYTDVVHVRFLDGRDRQLSDGGSGGRISDAFIFPYGPILLWGFTSEEERRVLDLLAPCTEAISPAGSASAESLADCEFMLFRPVQPTDKFDGGVVVQDDGISPASPPLATITNNVIRLRTDDATESCGIVRRI